MKDLNEETIDNLGYLAALGWTDAEMAGYLGLSEDTFSQVLAGIVPVIMDVGQASRIAEAVNQGRLEKRAEIEIAVAKCAATGDYDSVTKFQDLVRDKSFSVSKLDLFGGAVKEGAFERIQEYIASGSPGTLSKKEQVYIDLLNLIYSLDGHGHLLRGGRAVLHQPQDQQGGDA